MEVQFWTSKARRTADLQMTNFWLYWWISLVKGMFWSVIISSWTEDINMPSNQIKLNEQQLFYLADKAKNNAAKSGNLLVKLSDASTTKWNPRYFVLHMNFLFEFQNQESSKPTNVFLLEQCDFERTAMKNIHDYEHQVWALLNSNILNILIRVPFSRTLNNTFYRIYPMPCSLFRCP